MFWSSYDNIGAYAFDASGRYLGISDFCGIDAGSVGSNEGRSPPQLSERIVVDGRNGRFGERIDEVSVLRILPAVDGPGLDLFGGPWGRIVGGAVSADGRVRALSGLQFGDGRAAQVGDRQEQDGPFHVRACNDVAPSAVVSVGTDGCEHPRSLYQAGDPDGIGSGFEPDGRMLSLVRRRYIDLDRDGRHANADHRDVARSGEDHAREGSVRIRGLRDVVHGGRFGPVVLRCPVAGQHEVDRRCEGCSRSGIRGRNALLPRPSGDDRSLGRFGRRLVCRRRRCLGVEGRQRRLLHRCRFRMVAFRATAGMPGGAAVCARRPDESLAISGLAQAPAIIRITKRI